MEDGNYEILQECLKNDVNPDDVGGVRLLVVAARRGDLDMVRLLLHNGADPNCFDAKGKYQSALNSAALHAHPVIVEELIRSGADVNQGKEFGETPLMVAARSRKENSLKVVRILIAAGADINVVTDTGSTPLMYAASTGNVEVVEYLLEHGAVKNIKDSYNRSAADRLPASAVTNLRKILSMQ